LRYEIPSAYLNFGLIIVDIQWFCNGFVGKDGSYDKLGMNTGEYKKIIPTVQQSSKNILFFTGVLERRVRNLHSPLPRL
jgi:hypothetical protein